MLRRPSLALLIIAALSSAALYGPAQETKPTQEIKPAQANQAARPRLDRKAWVEAYLMRLQEVPRGKDPGKDAELVNLVTGYTWHSVPEAIEWVDSTDPAKKTRLKVDGEILLRRARVVARILAREKQLPALQALVHRVAGWREAEWCAFRAADAAYDEGQALRKKGAWREALGRYLAAARRLKAVGREDWVAWCLSRAGYCYFEDGSQSRAVDFFKRAVALFEKYGNEKDIAHTLGNLAASYGSSGRSREALEVCQRVLVLFEKCGDRAAVATTCANLGNAHLTLGRSRKALEFYQRALALRVETDDDRRIALSLNDLGVVHDSLGKFRQALDFHRRALALFEAVKDDRNLAMSLSNLGGTLNELGRQKVALEYHRRALAIREKIGNPQDIASSLTGLAVTLDSLGHHQEALAVYERVLRIRQEAGNESDIAGILGNLGVVHQALGHSAKALNHLRRALALFEKAGREPDIASCLDDMGLVWAHIGRQKKALECHRRALATREKTGNEGEIASSVENLGIACHALGRNEEALAYIRRALTLREKIGNEFACADVLGNMGLVLHALGRFQEALQTCKRALALHEKAGDEAGIASSANNLGLAYTDLGQHDKALASYRRALVVSERLGDLRRTAAALNNVGDAHRLLGRIPDARAYFARALAALSRARIRLSADPDRIAFVTRWQDFIQPAIEVALFQRLPDIAQDPALAFLALESLRGIATADLLHASLRGVRPSGAPQLTEQAHCIANEIDALEIRVRKTYRHGKPAERRILREKQQRLEAVWQDLLDRIARESPAYAKLERPAPVTLQAFQAMLPPDSAYLAVVLGEEKSVLVLVHRLGFHHWALPDPETINRAARAHIARLRVPPSRGRLNEVVKSGRRLFDMLLRPAEATVRRFKTLLVSPEGLLCGLPLETLVLPGEATDLHAAPFLLRRHAVLYVHSATVWSIQRELTANREAEFVRGSTRPSRVLVLGDPINPEEPGWAREGENRELLFAPTRAGFGRLPYTREEALSILQRISQLRDARGGRWRFEVDGRKLATEDFLEAVSELRSATSDSRHVRVTSPVADILLGRLASKEALLGMPLGHYRFLHIAAHGYLNERNPGLSGLFLSPYRNCSGFLRFMDIMNLRLNAEVVTLSGCDTACGKATRGEGFQGLVRAFLFAGAENVIAAAWWVPDQATADLLPGVYKSLLAEELSPVEALRRAKLHYLESVPPSTPEKAHPYYWGAWILWGTGMLTK